MVIQEGVKEIEPYVQCQAGVAVPTTGILNYQTVAQSCMHKIIRQNGKILLDTRVQRIKFFGNEYVVGTDKGDFQARFLLIALDYLYPYRRTGRGKKTHSKIIPFRGEYYNLKTEKQHLVKGLIYPVPNPKFPFLGIHLTRSLDGQIHAGPNAVLSLKREGYGKFDLDFGDALDTLTYEGFWRLAFRHSQKD